MSRRRGDRIPPTGDERGWAMLMTYGTMTVLLILVGTLISRSLTDIRAVQQYGRLRLSYYAAQGLAELGVEWMRAMMTRTPPWLPDRAVQLYPSPSPLPRPPLPQPVAEGDAPPSLEVVPPAALTGLPGVTLQRLTLQPYPLIPEAYQIIASTVGPRNLARQTTIVARVERFNDFAYFIGYTGDADPGPDDTRAHVWLQTGQVFGGDVHSNDWLYIKGSPEFHGTLSTAKSQLLYWESGADGSPWTTAAVGPDPNSSGTNDDGITPTYPADANPVNEIGEPLSQVITFGSAVPFPDPDAAMQRLLAAAQTGGYYFTGTTTVRFKTVTENGEQVGKLIVKNAAATGNVDEERPLPANGILCVNNGNLELQAAPAVEENYLKGVLTLCAAQGTTWWGGNVGLHTHLRYASELDPATAVPRDESGRIIGPPPTTATDMLAIVAERDIVVREGIVNMAWAIAAPSNLEVFGTLMALGDSLRATIDPVVLLNSSDHGTLTLVGSLIENRPEPLGTTTEDGTFVGYRPHFRYDPRVRSMPMPYIPMTGRVEILDTWTTPPETIVAARNWQAQPPPPPWRVARPRVPPRADPPPGPGPGPGPGRRQEPAPGPIEPLEGSL